jgi:hypothetical protein
LGIDHRIGNLTPGERTGSQLLEKVGLQRAATLGRRMRIDHADGQAERFLSP